MDNNKMIKVANGLDKLAKVLAGFLCAGAIVCAVFVVLVLVFGEKMFAPSFLTLELGFVELELVREYQQVTGSVKAFTLIGLCAGGVVCAALNKVLGCVRSILTPMKAGRPFENNVPKDLRKIAWIELGVGTLVQVTAMAEHALLARIYPLDEIFSSTVIAKVAYEYTMDLSFVLIFAIILFLSYIFEYGQKLQREVDETL